MNLNNKQKSLCQIATTELYPKQARRREFAAGGQKPHGVLHFSNTILDACSNRGTKHAMEVHKF